MQLLRVSLARRSLYCRVSASATEGEKPNAVTVVPAMPPAHILKNCRLLTCMESSSYHTAQNKNLAGTFILFLYCKNKLTAVQS
ncbi:hypothetical protein [Brenneria salicis]|uniref:hypothetical protein n=1 Tax=Brenneria salicis TaxID=55214 RepID=UPI001F0B8A7C|nr:hypothetical protein [Brenneria salicis]